MAKYDDVLTDEHGKPVRFPNGDLMPLEKFDGQEEFLSEVQDMSDDQFRKELQRMGLPVPRVIRP